MNDDELIMALREQRGKVSMTTPVEQIMSRGRAVRARRRVPRVAAALGVAGAAAVAVSVALPAGHPASGPGARLAAYAVSRHADGTIEVAFFGVMRHPAALQRTLRADGVPASVSFIGQQNPACQAYPPPPGPPDPIARWLKHHHHGFPALGPLGRVVPFGPHTLHGQAAMVIRPSALPSGAGLQIAVMRGIPPGPAGPWPYPKGSGHPVTEVGLVKVSPQCTGS
jgi:hypothetical protein